MYKVYDEWDGKEFIGTAETLNGVREIARCWYYNTEGHCQIWYYDSEGIGYFLDKF